jgi:hypothetical protein
LRPLFHGFPCISGLFWTLRRQGSQVPNPADAHGVSSHQLTSRYEDRFLQHNPQKSQQISGFPYGGDSVS